MVKKHLKWLETTITSSAKWIWLWKWDDGDGDGDGDKGDEVNDGIDKIKFIARVVSQ